MPAADSVGFAWFLSISHANHWKPKLCVRWFRDPHEKWNKTVLSEYFLTFIGSSEIFWVCNFVVQPFCSQIPWSESKASKRFVIPMKNGTRLCLQNIFWLPIGTGKHGIIVFMAIEPKELSLLCGTCLNNQSKLSRILGKSDGTIFFQSALNPAMKITWNVCYTQFIRTFQVISIDGFNALWKDTAITFSRNLCA